MKEEFPVILAIDIGTGSVRVHWMYGNGEIEATINIPIQVVFGPHGEAEVDPDCLWINICKAIRKIIDGRNPYQIVAVGLASALGYLFLDREGEPLGPTMLWMDRRATCEATELASLLNEDYLYNLTGRRLDPEALLPKLLWIRRHEPERFFQISHFLGIKDYIIRRLTGVIGTDLTHAAYTMLFDVAQKECCIEILEATGIPKRILPEWQRADKIAGRINKEGSTATRLPEGIPVVTGASDGTVACLTAGVTEKGTAVNVTGTSDVLMTAVARPLWDLQKRTFLNPHPILNMWMVGAVMGTTGGTIKWFTENFFRDLPVSYCYQFLNQEASSSEIGARGLIALTGLAGERAPLWNPYARGVIFGLDLRHNRGDIARSIMESVALTIKEMAAVLRQIGVDLHRLQVVGGGATSDLWNQIRADATGCPVIRPKIIEGTAIGISLLTGLGIGLYSDLGEAVRKINPPENIYHPNMESFAIYEEIARLRKSLYENIQDNFLRLEEFRQRRGKN